MRPARRDRGERLVGIARQPGAVALVVENAGDEFANVVLVVDDQNIGGHRFNSRLEDGGRRRCEATRAESHHDLRAVAAVGAFEAVEQLDVAVMILEDLDHDRQAEAGALGAGRHIGFRQLVAILRSGSPCRCR